MRSIAVLFAALLALAPAAAGAQDDITRTYVLSEFGTPKYGPDFQHFDYADPNAPKGGNLTLGAATESFDTLNPVPLGGESPRSIGLISEALMVQSQDELSSWYPLIAQSVEYPADKSWIVFDLNPAARWQDGRPLTADDVVWTFERVRAVGQPFLKSFYEDVDGVAALDEHRVRFTFKTRNVVKPLIRVAGLVIYPRHWWEANGRDIGKGTLEPPLGSGPYRLVEVQPGRTLIYERVPDYWGKDLPVNRGLWNFDRIRYDYYKDRDIEFEAFKAGNTDFRRDFTSRHWATGYDIPAVAQGRLVKTEIPIIDFRGMQGLFLNTRLPRFQDRRVREGLQYLFPFEWIRANLMYGNYQRMTSYFTPGTDWAAKGVPSGDELALLQPFRGQEPEEVFTREFTLPTNPEQGIGVSRDNVRTALRLFKEAGWEVQGGRLVNVQTGEPMTFEILLQNDGLQRHTQAYVQSLKQAGIDATLRIVDSAQFQQRYEDHDFEVISFAYTYYPPPGTELRNYFGSKEADVRGSANLMGIKDPAVDALIDKIIATDDPPAKLAASRALDRVLLWGYYCVPAWYNDVAWIAYWDKFGFPPNHPPYDFGMANTLAFQPTWWIDPQKEAALAAAR